MPEPGQHPPAAGPGRIVTAVTRAVHHPRSMNPRLGLRRSPAAARVEVNHAASPRGVDAGGVEQTSPARRPVVRCSACWDMEWIAWRPERLPDQAARPRG